jgi:prepilin-type N-terminal cleavage/methylation domain-containing protein
VEQAFGMLRDVSRGFTLLDLVVAVAILALLVWLVRLDWRPPAAVHGATHSRWTSV